MAIPDTVQTLLAAFSFGLVTQAAGGAIFLHSKNHVRVLLRDSRRLVLILFLLLAILWAITQFTDLFLSSKAFTACYANVIFSTSFDQLARVAFHQYLLWAIGEDEKSTLTRLSFYGILAIRLLAGGVLLGFTKPEFSPTCVARRSDIHESVLTLVLDVLIVVILATRLFVTIKQQDKSNASVQAKAKERALIFGIFGFMIWTGTGVPMILGLPVFILLLKTLLPAIGVLIVIGIITSFPGYFVTQSQDVVLAVGASAPYIGPAFSSENTVKAIAESPSSRYMQSRSLYVVNPSTPRDSQTPFGSSRGIMKTNENTPKNSIVNMSGNNDSVLTFQNNFKQRNNSTGDSSQSLGSYTPGYRGSSGIFPPQGNNQAALAPAIVGESGPNAVTANSAGTLLPGKRSILKWPLKISPEKQSIRNLPISNPIPIDQKVNDLEYLVRIPTVELEQAMFNERQRRDAEAAKSNLIASPLSRKPLNTLRKDSQPKNENSPTKLMTIKTMNISSPIGDKEKTIPSSQSDKLVPSSEVNITQDTKIAPIITPKLSSYSVKKVADYNYETGRTTSILPSPIPDELRRRSPMNKANLSSPVKSTLAFPPKDITQPVQNSHNLQQQELSGIEANNTKGTERIMLINEIIYDRPDIIENIMKDISGENPDKLRGYSNMLEDYPDIPEKYPISPGAKQIDTEKPIYCKIIDEPVPLLSVIDRPRPIQRRISRITPIGRRRSKSLGAIKSRATMAEYSTSDLDPLPLPPPLPTRAANLKRLLHEDTNDMARGEERIKYLFPAPPEAPKIVTRQKRILSLPCLAQMPSYQRLDIDESIKMPLKLEEPEKAPIFVNQSSKLKIQNSINSHQDQSQSNHSSLVPKKLDVPPNAITKSPEHLSTESKNIHNHKSSSNQSPIEDDTIDWDWLAELDPLETPKNNTPPIVNNSVVNDRDSQALNPNLKSEQQEIVTIMLKTPVQDNGNSQLSLTNQKEKKIFSAKVNQKSRRKIAEARDSWYCRVGERMPSFSGKRNEVFQTNKMPPPLMLDRSKIATAAKAQHSELTPPYHSNESADAGKQSPLSILEEKNPDYIELLLQQHQKNSLLGNDAEISLLEKEMEEQSNQWQSLQTNLDRDSIISILSQLPRESLQDSKKLYRSSDVDDILGPRASHLSIISNLSKELSPNTWQKQLAEAQVSYTALYNQRPSHFKFSNYQISSPTPPESVDSENENISEFEDEDETPRQSSINIPNSTNTLWRPASSSNRQRYNSMWNLSDSSSMFTEKTPPAADLRPPKRYIEHSLSIKSHSLWLKKFKYGRRVQSSSSWLSKIKDQEIYQNPEEEVNDFEHVDITSDYQENDKANVNSMENEFKDMDDMDDYSEYEEIFDESTLLKIATLLKTDNLPSNKSLLPPRRENDLKSYYDYFPKEELPDPVSILPLTINENFSDSYNKDFQVYQSLANLSKSKHKSESADQFLEAREVPRDTSHLKINEDISESLLWNREYSLDINIQSVGIQQPSPEIWRSLNLMPPSTYRTKSKKLNNDLPKFEIDKLWAKPKEKLLVKEFTGMWMNNPNFDSRNISTVESKVNASKNIFCAKLWTQKYPEESKIRSLGLQQPSPEAWRTLIAMPKDAPRSKPRMPDSNLPSLKPQSLWTKPQRMSLARGMSYIWEKSQTFITEESLRKKAPLATEEIYSQSIQDHQIVESQMNQKPVPKFNTEKQSLSVIDVKNTSEPKKDLQATNIRNEVREKSKIESNEITFDSMLWNPNHHSDKVYESFGIQQPSSEAWQALNNFSKSYFWSKPKSINASLPKFQNESMWVKNQQVKTQQHEASTMWITKHNSKLEEKFKLKPVITSNSKMIYSKLWTKKHSADSVTYSLGLQQPSPEAWRALSVMPEQFSKSISRVSGGSLLILQTNNLWTKQRQFKTEKIDTNEMWTNEKVIETREKSEEKSIVNSPKKTLNTMLWTQNHSFTISTQSFGLEQPSLEAWTALSDMPEQIFLRKPNLSEGNLPILQTDKLWAKQQKVKTEKNDVSGIWKNENILETQDMSQAKLEVKNTEKTFNAMLWTKKLPTDLIIHSVGLQQPSPEAWRALTIMPEQLSRSILRVSEGSLQTIKVGNLWTHQQKVKTKENDAIEMWTNENVSDTREKYAVKSLVVPKEKNANTLLWTKMLPADLTVRSVGLQQPSPEAWRALSVMPEQFSKSKSHVSGGSLLILQTDDLWTKQQKVSVLKNKASAMWTNERVLEAREKSEVKSEVNSQEKTHRTMLWTKKLPTDLIIHSVGLQQPSPEVWRALSVMPEQFSKSKSHVSGGSLLILQTDDLWTKQQKVSVLKNKASAMWTNERVLETREKSEVKSEVNSQEKTHNTMLWTHSHLSNITTKNFGKHQPLPEVWRILTFMPEKRSQCKPRVSEGNLPMLQTDKLWSKQQQFKTKKVDTNEMWTNKKDLETLDISKVKSRINSIEKTLHSTLWTQSDHKNTHTRILGLQQPSPEAWRALSCNPAELTRSKLKISDIDPVNLENDSLSSLQLSSTKLWSLGENKNKEISWITKCMTLDQKPSPELASKTNYGLWKKKTVKSKASFIGINNSSSFQAYIYQVEAMSSASNTIHKPRYPKLPSDQLTSKKLWKKTIKIPIQRDWISESSVRPASPTFSSSSSLSFSPISDASSIFSISTKASSIWAVQEMPSLPVVSFTYPSISEGNSLDLKAIYDGNRGSKSSIGPKLARPTPLAAVLESNQQILQKSRKIEDNQLPKHIAHMSKKYQKSAASEYKNIETTKKTSSLLKSKPNNPLTRRFVASPDEWKSALTEAILAGNTATL